jgi:hypothetical protein
VVQLSDAGEAQVVAQRSAQRQSLLQL